MQEQPLRVEQPIKEDVEEPMEVVEIPQEGGDPAVKQDDDQPLDYNIDEYLYDPSKHFLFHIHNLVDIHHADYAELAKHLIVASGDDDAEDGDSAGQSDSDDDDAPRD